MKIRKPLALLMAVLMLLSVFSACASDEVEPDASSNAGTATPENNGGEIPDDDEIVNIRFWMNSMNSCEDLDKIEDAVNAITEDAIQVHVDMEASALADFGTQITLAISNNEAIDVATYNPRFSWTNAYANGLMLDMSDLLDTYGKDIKKLFGEKLLSATTVDGKVYGLVNYKMLNTNTYFMYRTDVLEQLGVLDTYKNMKTWDDFEVVLQAIKDSDTGLYPIGGTSGKTGVVAYDVSWGTSGDLDDAYTWDMLSDASDLIQTDDNGNVGLTYADPNYVAGLKRAADWYNRGYIYADSNVTSDTAETLTMQNVLAGFLVNGEYGVESDKSSSCGHPMSAVELVSGATTCSSAVLFGMFIPSSSTQPEAAMKFLNLMYTNADLMNLLIWGIEGEHYIVEDGVAYYPDGLDASSVGYHQPHFMMGNQFLLYPWDGSYGGSTFRTDSEANFLNAPFSIYLGLSVDASSLDTQIAAISTVRDEYRPNLNNGLYTEAMLAEFLEKLEAVGWDEYQAFYQSAVDDFLA